jgi:hypothetical protein
MEQSSRYQSTQQNFTAYLQTLGGSPTLSRFSITSRGKSTETFADLNFPVIAVILDDLNPAICAESEQIALNACLVPGTFEFETTVLGVALSGDPAFAEATQDISVFNPNFDPATDFNKVVSVAVNEAPTARPDTAIVLEGSSVEIAMLINDFDPEGDAISSLGVSDENGGLVNSDW